MISEFIKNYGEIGMQGVLCITGAYVVWYLIRSIMGMFKNELKELHKDNIINNGINIDNKKLNKDIAVIIAQTLTKVEKHDQMSSEAWGKVLTGFDRICDFLNGKNPAITKLRAEIKEMKEKIK